MRNLRNITALALLASLLSLNTSFANTNFSYEQTNNSYSNYSQPSGQNYDFNAPTLKGRVVQVPAGSTVKAVLANSISSENANVGDLVSMRLDSPFYYNGQLIAASGSFVSGSVIQAVKAKHGTINGKLCIRFTQINTPTGNTIPLSAVIKTNDNSGVLVGGTKMDTAKEYTKDLVVGSAAGALSGVVFGALAGGNIGRGAALGTAVGAGGGLVKSAIDKGQDVTIPTNSSIELVLTQPLTATVSDN